MKALNNPFVVGGLAVAAAVVVFRSSFKKEEPPPPPPAPLKKEPSKKPSASKGNVTAEIEGAEPGAGAGIETTEDGWVQWPKRDPFDSAHRLMPAPRVVVAVEKKVQSTLELSAVWLQDTGKLAVINGRIVGEGDTVLEYRVEKILEDHVMVEGRDGPEIVRFKAVSAPAIPPAVVEGDGAEGPDGAVIPAAATAGQ